MSVAIGPKFNFNICFIMFTASEIESALKIIHVKFINENVKSQLNTGFAFSIVFLNILFKIDAIPCNIPHSINVKLAPCHIPLAKNTKNMFTYVLIFPFLFPPSGMYICCEKSC